MTSLDSNGATFPRLLHSFVDYHDVTIAPRCQLFRIESVHHFFNVFEIIRVRLHFGRGWFHDLRRRRRWTRSRHWRHRSPGLAWRGVAQTPRVAEVPWGDLLKGRPQRGRPYQVRLRQGVWGEAVSSLLQLVMERIRRLELMIRMMSEVLVVWEKRWVLRS